MRITKERLRYLMPDLKVFLDVDDLYKGRGAELVDKSQVLCIFCSDGYFSSPNCMRELLRAAMTGTPMVALCEADADKGGLTLSDNHAALSMKNQLSNALQSLPKWGLDVEIMAWDKGPMPTFDELFEKIFLFHEPIEWSRVPAYRDVALRQLVENLILPVEASSSSNRSASTSRRHSSQRRPSSADSANSPASEPRHTPKSRERPSLTYMAACPSRAPLDPLVPPETPYTHHVYCSADNLGADGIMRELSEWISSERSTLHRCQHYLLYLNRRTWTSGAASEALGREVARAMSNGMHILLVHEQPDVADEFAESAPVWGRKMRGGCKFDFFFHCNEGSTPRGLVRGGLYDEIAVPLKGGVYRDVSMALLSKAVGELPTVGLLAFGGAAGSSGLRRTSSAGTMEAVQMAAVRRQQSAREAEFKLVEAAGAARREKQTKQAETDMERQIIAQRGQLRSVVGMRNDFAALAPGRVPEAPPPVFAEAPAPAAPVSPVADAFARFLAASDVGETQLHYNACVGCLSLAQPVKIDRLSPALAPLVPHRSRQLLVGLEARSQRPEYQPPKGVRPRATLSVVVIGAGPVGLRTAIELALLGARVEVLEGRERFSRLQVLHLWEWVECDLIELGIKHIDPSIFSAADLRRCSTSQMQHSLHKVALLLGVRVRFNCRVDNVEALSTLHPKRVDVLVDGSGARCGLLDSLGFSQQVALRSARALCIVISLANGKSPEELELRESTWSQQYFLAEFGALMHQGIVLENLVYYRSTGAFADAATHYFVMTTTSDALHAFGALRELTASSDGSGSDDVGRRLCAPSNVDTERLESYARSAVSAFVPELSKHPVVPGQLTLFDFSERKQSNRAATVVSGTALGDARQDGVCLVARVGDALQEPFWPEGLGINRGFLGALDCADLVQRAMPLLMRPLGQPLAALGEFGELLRRREEIYGLTKRLSGANRLNELRPHLDGQRKFCYTLNPATRYGAWTRVEPPLHSARGPNSARQSARPHMKFHAAAWNGSVTTGARLAS